MGTADGTHRPRRAGSVTHLLIRWRSGDERALPELVERVHPDLCAIAAAHLRRLSGGATLEPAAVVNELYLRLVGGVKVDFRDRRHFFAIASVLARQVLVDRARRRLAKKRRATLVPLDDTVAAARPPVDLTALDEALEGMARRYPLPARVVELRYFGGLTVEEVAAHEQVSRATVERSWSFARAWLFRALSSEAARPQKKTTADSDAAL